MRYWRLRDRCSVAVFRMLSMDAVPVFIAWRRFIYFLTGLDYGGDAKLSAAVYKFKCHHRCVVFIDRHGIEERFPMLSWLQMASSYHLRGYLLIAPLMTKVFAYVLIRMLVTIFLPASYITVCCGGHRNGCWRCVL